jgi:hypothetical protein
MDPRSAMTPDRAKRFVGSIDEIEIHEPPTDNAFCPTGKGGGIDDSCSPGKSRSRSELAKRTYKPSTAAKQRKGEAEQSRLAKLTGSFETEDNAAFDLIKGKNGVEVKTLIDNDNDKITVHPESRRRKEEFAHRNNLKMHTVAVDTRGGRRGYYYKAGVGAYRVASMEKLSLQELNERLR